jgi:hypothetical protein
MIAILFISLTMIMGSMSVVALSQGRLSSARWFFVSTIIFALGAFLNG